MKPARPTPTGKPQCDCRDCRHARGPVTNHLVYCPLCGHHRAVGLRSCYHFEPRKRCTTK